MGVLTAPIHPNIYLGPSWAKPSATRAKEHGDDPSLKAQSERDATQHRDDMKTYEVSTATLNWLQKGVRPEKQTARRAAGPPPRPSLSRI